MKIKNLLHDVLVESVKNKKLFELLMTKWKQEKPNLTPEEGEALYNEFQRIKEGLLPNRPQVISFLYRFDGKHGYEKFDPDYLKDITKYTYKQLKSLLDEYKDDDFDGDVDSIFSSKDTASTPEKIVASKELWYSSDNAIINEDGFRVYDIKDQKMSIIYGYYVEQENGKFKGANLPWCVTWRSDQGRVNQWSSYRGYRTFYFVIDESKPETDRYRLSALQKDTSNTVGYTLTSIKNDGDIAKTWNELIAIYPKLANHKDLIVTRKYSLEEISDRNVVGMVTETENNPYEFKRVDRQLKKAFLNNGGVLRKPESWASIDEKLRSLYILLTNAENLNDRFSNYNFILEVKKVGNQFTLLDNRLKQVGIRDGVGHLTIQLLKNEFKLRRESLDNPQIKIFESKVNGLCGVYHSRYADWLKFDGVTYEPSFKETDTTVYFDEDENSYFVEKYTNKMGKSFYTIYPTDDERGDSYIISEKKWKELEQKLFKDEADIERIQTFEPDSDVDIKERKMGE